MAFACVRADLLRARVAKSQKGGPQAIGEEEAGRRAREGEACAFQGCLSCFAAAEEAGDEGDVPVLPIEPQAVGRFGEVTVLIHEV